MTAPSFTDRLLYAKVLLECGEVAFAEQEVAALLEEDPSDLTAFSLFARIKHIRGEISLAVACWAQIHGRSPHNETALMNLSAILHLARDPERGAEEYMALSQSMPLRKPAAQLELEKAFRLFLQRRTKEARAACESLAQKYKAKDRQMYKLGVMASAWIAELSGDLQGSCAQLEALGRERGFETDTDRVLSLMRVYQRIGTPEKLEAALNICRFIERNFEKISVLSHLAAIHERLGKKRLAAEYEQRYLDAFRRRMHRPLFSETTRIAAARYIPLSQLRRIRFPHTEQAADIGKRERALGLALTGDIEGARVLLCAGAEPLDELYLADLAAIEGRDDEAAAGYLRTLCEGAWHIYPIGWLLDHHARQKGPAELSTFFRDPESGNQALQLMRAAVRAAPLCAPLWQQLAELCRIQGQEEEAARVSERAAALSAAATRRALPTGRVLAAAVYHFVGKSKGLIHEIWADRKPVGAGQGGFLLDEDILGNLRPDMKHAIRNTFLAVREYARSKFPHLTLDILDYNYTYKVTKEDEPSGGVSAGLPSALAFLSVFLQRPVPQDIAYSGMIVADSHDVLVVRRIGEAEYKVKGAYNRNLRMLVLPLENRQDILSSREVPRAISEEMVSYVTSLDEAASMTFGEEIW